MSHPRSLAEFWTGTAVPHILTTLSPFRSSGDVPQVQLLPGDSFIPRHLTNSSSVPITATRTWTVLVITAQLSANMETLTVGETDCMTWAARMVRAHIQTTLAAQPSGTPHVLGVMSPICPEISMCLQRLFNMAMCASV